MPRSQPVYHAVLGVSLPPPPPALAPLLDHSEPDAVSSVCPPAPPCSATSCSSCWPSLALFRDERRRLARIEPGLLEPEVEVEGGPALPHAALFAPLLDPSERTHALSPAPREEATASYYPAPAPLSPARSLDLREGAPARPGPRPIVILANRRNKCVKTRPW